MLVGSPGSVSNNTQKVQRLHTLLFQVTNVWKECELIVKNDSEEFGLFNNRDGSTIECSGGSRGRMGDAPPPPAVWHIGIFMGDV